LKPASKPKKAGAKASLLMLKCIASKMAQTTHFAFAEGLVDLLGVQEFGLMTRLSED